MRGNVFQDKQGNYITENELLKQFNKELQQENQNLKERIAYLERSNDRREELILELRDELVEEDTMIDNWNKLKEYISIKLYNTEYLQKLCGCGIDDFDHILLDAIREKMQKLEEGEK